MQNGASGSTNLYGPGNSQPHKASLCANGKNHLVDVHAFKAHAGAGVCASSSTGTPSTSTSTSTSTPTSGSVSGATHGSSNSNGQGTKAAFTPPSTNRNGGTGSQGSVAGTAKAAHPVLGTANFTG
jgi:hypothetical protein